MSRYRSTYSLLYGFEHVCMAVLLFSSSCPFSPPLSLLLHHGEIASRRHLLLSSSLLILSHALVVTVDTSPHTRRERIKSLCVCVLPWRKRKRKTGRKRECPRFEEREDSEGKKRFQHVSSYNCRQGVFFNDVSFPISRRTPSANMENC